MISIYKNKKRLISKVELITQPLKQGRGLMFSKQKNLLFAFYKERINSLHMFFVFYPIDVIFMDSKQKVVDLKKDFKPFRFYFSRKKSKYIIETKKGLIDKLKIKIGDKLSF